MERRTFLKALGIYLISGQFSVPGPAWAFTSATPPARRLNGPLAAHPAPGDPKQVQGSYDGWLSKDEYATLQSVLARFTRIQATVGYGNFCLLGFDDGLKIARGYQRIGAFPGGELTFLDKLYHTDARQYGFKGRKMCQNITDTIDAAKVRKIPGTGNYLYDGVSRELYSRISRDIGDQLVLTAGIRGVVKQFHLFLKKAAQTRGNLSTASRSLAPPGYSFHGVGDFDVGQVGFGSANFTERFSHTKVYRKMSRLNYVVFRYPRNNQLGVRFEPWHIQASPDMA